MKKSFRDRLAKGELLAGTFITLPSPEIAEILSGSEFDWLFIDMEHTSLDVQCVQRILQAVKEDFPCLVRVPAHDEVWIKGVLDAGPTGIIVPHVNSAAQVEQVLRWCRYPPEGTRSVGISRAQGYGMKLSDYVESANLDTLVIPQVEHIEGVQNIRPILKVEGVEAIFVGPYDLSGSMGKLGNVSDPQVLAEIKKIADACLKAAVPAGIFGVDAEAVLPYLGMGYSLIAVGSDTMFLGKAARQTSRSLKRHK